MSFLLRLHRGPRIQTCPTNSQYGDRLKERGGKKEGEGEGKKGREERE